MIEIYECKECRRIWAMEYPLPVPLKDRCPKCEKMCDKWDKYSKGKEKQSGN